MLKIRSTYLLLITALFCCTSLSAQEGSDFGLSLEAKLNKELSKRWSVGIEEEVRLKGNFTEYDRSVTSATIEYTVVPKVLKLSVLYSFLNVNDNDHLIQNRHRYALMARVRQDVGPIKLSLRLRYQSTYKQEVRKPYKINPENYLRTKLEAAYKITRSRWEPSVSAEVFYTLNDPYRNVVDKIRTEAVLDYRINREQYIAGVIRVDIPVQDKNPQTAVLFGISYKFNL